VRPTTVALGIAMWLIAIWLLMGGNAVRIG